MIEMREIKFRAWDRENRRMITDFIDQGERSFLNREGNLVKYHYYDLMQYTGLKDKNGKEIYEGDIVRNINKSGQVEACYYTKKPKIASIEWFKTEFRWGEHGAIYCALGFANYEPEVIGNVYENPELLETK